MLGLEKASIDEYPSLKVLVTSVYEAFESYTGRAFELDTYTETVEVDGFHVPLKALPVSAVAAITPTDGGATPPTLEAAQIRAFGLILAASFDGPLAVTYTGGYEDRPDPLHRAALLQVLHEWQRRDTIGATSVSTDGGSTSWPELGLLKEVKRLLDPFVHTAKVW